MIPVDTRPTRGYRPLRAIPAGAIHRTYGDYGRAYLIPGTNIIGLNGLGDCIQFDESGDCIDSTTPAPVPPSQTGPGFPIFTGSGYCDAAQYDCSSCIPAGTCTAFPTTSSGTPPSGISAGDWAKIISASGQAFVAGIRATSPPTLIPGTSVVYDPSSGKFLPASGINLTAGAVGSSLTTMLPMVMGIVVFVVLIGSLRK